jgi:hypothetical protein
MESRNKHPSDGNNLDKNPDVAIEMPETVQQMTSDDPFGESIDVLERIRAVLLCCNRTFPEEGIAAVIMQFYRGPLMEDVLDRMWLVGKLARETELAPERYNDCVHELANYVDTFQHCHFFVIRSMAMFSMMAFGQGEFIYAILCHTLPFFMILAQRTVYPDGIAFLMLLNIAMFRSLHNDSPVDLAAEARGANQLMERALDAGLANVILEVKDACVGLGRSPRELHIIHNALRGTLQYIVQRPSHPHSDQLEQLMQAFLSLREHLDALEEDEMS